MAKVKYLQDTEGNPLYPANHTNAIYDNNGITLEERLTNTENLLSEKVDKSDGKSLSTNDYTNEEKEKLSEIEYGAGKNVQSDWNETDASSDAFINNKPAIPDAYDDTLLSNRIKAIEEEIPNLARTDNINDILDNKVDKDNGFGLSSNDYTSAEKNKLQGIEENANNYIHPGNHPADIILQDETHRFVTDIEKNAWDMTYQQAAGYTDTKIAELINGAPSTLDTLGEIADAMQNNADVVEALDSSIGSKASQAELDGHINNSTIHVTADERNIWNSKADSTHTHSKADIGLGNADNTSDADKPISSATQSALNNKQDAATAINTSNIGSQSVNYANSAGVSNSSEWLKVTKRDWSGYWDGWIRAFRTADSNVADLDGYIEGEDVYLQIRADRAYNDEYGNSIAATYLPVSGKANTAGSADMAHALQTYSASGDSHNGEWLLRVQHNRSNDGYFNIYCKSSDGNEIGTKVNYADSAGTAGNAYNDGNGNNIANTYALKSETNIGVSSGSISTSNISSGNIYYVKYGRLIIIIFTDVRFSSSGSWITVGNTSWSAYTYAHYGLISSTNNNEFVKVRLDGTNIQAYPRNTSDYCSGELAVILS